MSTVVSVSWRAGQKPRESPSAVGRSNIKAKVEFGSRPSLVRLIGKRSAGVFSPMLLPTSRREVSPCRTRRVTRTDVGAI